MSSLRAIHVISTGPGFGNWSAAEGVRRYLPDGVPSIDYRRVDPTEADVLIIGGGGFLHSGAEPFWRRVAAADCRVILWGLGACQPLPGSPDHGRLRPLDTRIMARIRPRIVLAAVRDEWTRDLYGLDAKLLFCPTIKTLEGIRMFRSNRSLYAHHPGLVSEAESRRIARFCDRTTGHWNNPWYVIRLHASSGLCVTSRLHGAVVSRALGVPYMALERDRKIVAFVRRWAGGLLMRDEGRGFQQLRELPSLGSNAPSPAVGTLGNDRFATEVHHLLGTNR